MADLFGMLQAASGSGGGEPDPYFNQTTLLLHGDGTDGAQNNTFLDSSTNNFTITRNGNTTQGTFSPFSVADGEWSNYFDGSGDYLQLAATTDLIAPSGTDYTLEFWFNAGRTTNGNRLIGSYPGGTDGNWIVWFYSGKIGFYQFPTISTNVLESTTTIATNTWYHFAICREGSTTRLFLNGALEDSTTIIYNLGIVTNPWTVGRTLSSTDYYQGYLSNISFLKGTAKYTSAFTPSTTPLSPSATNQKLLTCYSNRFVDANTATTAKTITVNGNTSIQPFSPFAPSAVYSPSVNGGSGYFDGTGDYLSVGLASSSDVTFGAGDFTIECWIYITTNQVQFAGMCMQDGANPWYLSFSNTANGVRFNNASTIFLSATVSLNTWTHIAVSRSGTSLKMFFNGVEVSSATNSTSFGNSANSVILGYGQTAGPAYFFNGHMSGVKLTKGTALYTSAFTPPTAPPTGGNLCINFTNAGIFDNTGKNNLETVGNAQIDTTIVKYGTGSMEFDGTGDKLFIAKSDALSFGTGDFTVEYWFYLNAGGTQRFVTGSAATASDTFQMYLFSTNEVSLLIAGAVSNPSTTINTGTWYHRACTRENGVIRQFINGVQVGTNWTRAVSIDNVRVTIGDGIQYAGPVNGYIDDLRITKGVARYTTTFTPPEAPFPDQ